MIRTVLDGGCTLIELRPRWVPEAPRVWRQMTPDEHRLAMSFGRYLLDAGHPISRGGFAAAMFDRACWHQDITDKQGKAIHSLARRHRIVPPRRYTAADVPELRATIAEREADLWNDCERLHRIIRLLELGCDHVDGDPRGLLVGDMIFVGPTSWRPAAGGKWRRYESLAEVVK
jgi:hypothetical protein